MPDDPLTAGPLDTSLDIAEAPPDRRRRPPVRDAHRGLVLEDRASGVVGALVEFNPPRLVLRDRHGKDHVVRYAPGSVRADIDGKHSQTIHEGSSDAFPFNQCLDRHNLEAIDAFGVGAQSRTHALVLGDKAGQGPSIDQLA